MPNVAEVLAELAEKAGIDTTSDELKPLMSLTAEVPDAVAKKISSSLISIDDAVKKQGVKNQIIKNYGAGLLQNYEEILKELGMPDDLLKEVTQETTIGKKIEKGLRKIAEIKSKADPNSTADQKALNEQITKLNKELNDIKTTHIPKSDHEAQVSKFENERLEAVTDEFFNKHKWSEAYADPDIKKAAYSSKLNRLLEEKGLKLERSGKNIKIILKEGGSEYFDDKNKIVTFDEVVNQIMADNKFSAVSGTTPSTTTTVLSGPQGNQQVKGNPKYHKTMELLKKSQADQIGNQAN